MNWDAYFISFAEVAASKSRDPSSQYGAVIVDPRNTPIATGYNGLPRGVEYRDELYRRPDKYFYFVHAEQNAIFNAAASGVSTLNCIMYVLRPPCVECVKAIVQSGIRRVVYKEPHPVYEEKELPRGFENYRVWDLNLQAAADILGEGGVGIRQASYA